MSQQQPSETPEARPDKLSRSLLRKATNTATYEFTNVSSGHSPLRKIQKRSADISNASSSVESSSAQSKSAKISQPRTTPAAFSPTLTPMSTATELQRSSVAQAPRASNSYHMGQVSTGGGAFSSMAPMLARLSQSSRVISRRTPGPSTNTMPALLSQHFLREHHLMPLLTKQSHASSAMSRTNPETSSKTKRTFTIGSEQTKKELLLYLGAPSSSSNESPVSCGRSERLKTNILCSPSSSSNVTPASIRRSKRPNKNKPQPPVPSTSMMLLTRDEWPPKEIPSPQPDYKFQSLEAISAACARFDEEDARLLAKAKRSARSMTTPKRPGASRGKNWAKMPPRLNKNTSLLLNMVTQIIRKDEALMNDRKHAERLQREEEAAAMSARTTSPRITSNSLTARRARAMQANQPAVQSETQSVSEATSASAPIADFFAADPTNETKSDATIFSEFLKMMSEKPIETRVLRIVASVMSDLKTSEGGSHEVIQIDDDE